MLFWVRTIGLDVGSEIYPGSHLKDASWGAPQTGLLEVPTHRVGGHRTSGCGRSAC